MGYCHASSSGIAGVGPAAAYTRRWMEPGAQRPRLSDNLPRSDILINRAPAGGPFRPIELDPDTSELPALALVHHRGGVDCHGGSIPRRGADAQLVPQLRPDPRDRAQSED